MPGRLLHLVRFLRLLFVLVGNVLRCHRCVKQGGICRVQAALGGLPLLQTHNRDAQILATVIVTPAANIKTHPTEPGSGGRCPFNVVETIPPDVVRGYFPSLVSSPQSLAPSPLSTASRLLPPGGPAKIAEDQGTNHHREVHHPHARTVEGVPGGSIDPENHHQQAGDNHSDEAQHFSPQQSLLRPLWGGVQPVRYHVFTLV